MNRRKLIVMLICGVIGALFTGLLSGVFDFGGTWFVGLGAGLGVLVGFYLNQKRPESPAR